VNSPTVSILTPVYNRRTFIRASIESSLAQTYTDFELVIIDNVSTDGTWEICKEYARQDSRIRLLRNDTNIGGMRNWILTCQEARGKFGKMVFSDDTLHPRFLETAVPMMADDVAFVYSPAEIGEEQEKGQIFYRWKETTGFYSVEDYLHGTLLVLAPTSPGSTLHRVADMRKNLRTDIVSPTIADFATHGVGPDLFLQLLTADAYPKVGFIAEPMALFRSHSGTMTRAVEGRRDDCYAQVRISFGLKSRHRWYLTQSLGAAWLRKMRERGGWVSADAVKRQFLCSPDEVSTAELVAGTWNVFAAKLRHRLSA